MFGVLPVGVSGDGERVQLLLSRNPVSTDRDAILRGEGESMNIPSSGLTACVNDSQGKVGSDIPVVSKEKVLNSYTEVSQRSL